LGQVTPGLPFKQIRLHAIFESVNAIAHGRLRDTQSTRRFTDAPRVGDGQKIS